MSDETYRERIARAEPRHGDLVYSREGTYFGIAAELPPGVRVCLGQRMVLLRPNENKANFRFLRYWLNSPVMNNRITLPSGELLMKNINDKQWRRLLRRARENQAQ